MGRGGLQWVLVDNINGSGVMIDAEKIFVVR